MSAWKASLEKIRKTIKKKKEQMDYSRYDDFGCFACQDCFRVFPHSFYLMHTKEEVKRITKETVATLQEMIADLE